jgi:hypothetical protein
MFCLYYIIILFMWLAGVGAGAVDGAGAGAALHTIYYLYDHYLFY